MDGGAEACLREEHVGSPIEGGSGSKERIIETEIGRDLGNDGEEKYCQGSEHEPSSKERKMKPGLHNE